jgi:hypothetical protein
MWTTVRAPLLGVTMIRDAGMLVSVRWDSDTGGGGNDVPHPGGGGEL